MEKDITIHVRLDRELHDKIKEKAKGLGLTVVAYLRMMMIKDVQDK